MTTSKNMMHSNDTSKDIFQKRVNLLGNLACAGYISIRKVFVVALTLGIWVASS